VTSNERPSDWETQSFHPEIQEAPTRRGGVVGDFLIKASDCWRRAL